jgi:hypothetical protein
MKRRKMIAFYDDTNRAAIQSQPPAATFIE